MHEARIRDLGAAKFEKLPPGCDTSLGCRNFMGWISVALLGRVLELLERTPEDVLSQTPTRFKDTRTNLGWIIHGLHDEAKHTGDHFATEGHALRCLYRPTSNRGGFDQVSDLEWTEGDLGDSGSANRLVDGCQAVVHAALHRPGKGFRGAEGSYRLVTNEEAGAATVQSRKVRRWLNGSCRRRVGKI